MYRLLQVTTGVSIILFLVVLVSVRRSHIRVEYSVSWLLAAVGLFGLSRSPNLMDAVARYLGLPDSPLALALIGGVVFLIMSFRAFVILSQLRDDNIALAQRVAILEYHINSLREQGQGSQTV
jgi:hypothetical protein